MERAGFVFQKRWLLMLAGLLSAWYVAAGSGPLFRAGFDDSNEPEISANRSPVRIYGSPRFRPGVKDSAVLVGTKDRLEYSAEGNWNNRAGTLVFYFAPYKWTPAMRNFAFSVTLSRESGDDFLIYKLSDSTELSFLLRNSANQGSGNVKLDVAAWKEGEFHQLAVTWDASVVRCYVDGVCQGSFAKFDFPDFRNIVVGTPYPGWANLGEEKWLIDELELYDAPWSEAQLAAAFRQFKTEVQAEHPSQDYRESALLYVPFDDSFQAGKAPKDALSRSNTPDRIAFAPGIAGKAMKLEGAALPSVYYTGTGLPDPAAGTCIVWVKPEWPPASDDVYFLVSFLGSKGRLLLYKPHQTGEFALLLQDNARPEPVMTRSVVENYRPGDWIMFAFTWDAKTARFYINGEAAGSVPALTVPWDLVNVGAAYRDWPSVGTGATLFDDLLILSQPLNGTEIRDWYRKMLENNPELQAAAKKSIEDRKAAEKNNLALKQNGGRLVASTFADYEARYSDNLIDNNLSTLWSPFGTEREPFFLELYFQYPRTIDRLTLETASQCRITAARVLNYNVRTDCFEEVKKLTPKELETGVVTFPPITVSRLRLEVDSWGEGMPTLAEFGAYGPEQPIPGRNEPYWDAWYIWHQEKGDTYYAGEMRYLRTEFDLKDMNFTSAVIQSRSNDYYKLWINDQLVDTGAVALTPHEVGKMLRPGKNVIAAETKLSRHPGVWGWGEFLTELAINYPGHSRKIGSGPEWVGAAEVPANWRTADCDASGWQKVFCYTRPPEGPWGRIPYTDSAVRSHARLVSAAIPPGPYEPGTALKLQFRLAGEGNLARDYFFAVEGGFGPLLKRYGDYCFNRKLADCRDNGDGTVTVTCDFELPPWTPRAPQPLRLVGFNRATGVELQIDGLPDGQAGMLAMAPAPAVPAAAGVARIAYPKGQAAFEIDGRTVPPLMWRAIDNNDPRRCYMEAHYGDIHVKNFILYGGNIDVGGDAAFEAIFATLDRRIRTWLDIDPEGTAIVLVDLRPTASWMDANPGCRHINAFGRESNIVSFGSEVFYRACSEFMRKLIDRLKQQDYYSRIVGFQPWVCGVPDSCMGGVEENTWQTDRTKLTAGDFNPGALEKFRAFLRTRYGNDVERLRRAWHRNDVTFDTAAPEIARLVTEPPAGEVLRDPAVEGMMAFDYADFLPTLLGNFQRRFFAEVKAATDRKKMTFTHYGFIVEHMRGLNTPAGGLNDNNYDLPQWLEDDNIDGYIGAPCYASRFSGQPHLTYFPWSSFALHRRMYLPDDDTRYFQSGAVSYGHNRSLAESRAVIRRNVGADITRNFGSWFADMSVGTGRAGIAWTGYREIAEELGAMTRLYREAQEQGYESAAEIAVIVSPGSMKYLDVMYGATLMNSLIAQTYYEQIFDIGAPFDIYMQSDLSAPDFPRGRYKLYCMMNSFNVPAADREAIDAIRRTRPGTTWLWFYLPGYVDAEKGNRVENIEALTGIKVRKVAGKAVPAARFRQGGHRLLEGAVAGTAFQMPLMPEISVKMHPNELAPQLRIDDPAAEVLAEFPDGGGAVAVKDCGSWRSVYTAVPYLNKAFLRNLLRYAGVHVYTDAEVVFDANRRFIVLNNGNQTDRQVPLALPRPALRVTDALTGEVLGQSVRELVVPLPKTTTRILRLEWPQEQKP